MAHDQQVSSVGGAEQTAWANFMRDVDRARVSLLIRPVAVFLSWLGVHYVCVCTTCFHVVGTEGGPLNLPLINVTQTNRICGRATYTISCRRCHCGVNGSFANLTEAEFIRAMLGTKFVRVFALPQRP